MAHVAIALGTENLAPEPVRIPLLVDRALDVGPETGPAAAAIELHVGGVQRLRKGEKGGGLLCFSMSGSEIEPARL